MIFDLVPFGETGIVSVKSKVTTMIMIVVWKYMCIRTHVLESYVFVYMYIIVCIGIFIL